MTKKQRVVQAINKMEVDGIPSCFSMHFPAECANGELAIRAHLDFLKETDVDILKIMNENLVSCDWRIENREDYERIPAVSIKDPFMQKQVNLVKEILEQAPEDCFKIGTLHSVGTSAMYHPFKKMGYGYDQSRKKIDQWLEENPKKILEVMDRITDGLCELATEYIALGLDGVFVASLGAERRFGFTREQFREWIMPFDQRIMKSVKDAGGYCILHVCNKDVNLDYYQDYDEDLYDVVNWGTFEVPCSLKEGRNIFKEKSVMGGLANRSGVLIAGDDDLLENTIKSIIESYGRRGLILGADCTIATEQEITRIKRAVEIARTL